MEKVLRDPSSAQSQALQLICILSRLLLVFWLEGQLSDYRADANRNEFQQTPGQGVGNVGKAIRHAIRKRITGYQRAIQDWDHELRKLTGRSLFISRFADAQRFRAIAKEMQTINGVSEAGWAAQADVAQEEIRYQVFEELRKGSITWTGFPVAGILWLIRLTTGYGMKPARFVWTGVVTILAFAFLFFFNDFFNPGVGVSSHFCPQAAVADMPWYLVPIRYLYLAVTNLSSLGSDPSIVRYCGGASTQVLLIASALTGYFLLATLAALMFKLLMDSI